MFWLLKSVTKSECLNSWTGISLAKLAYFGLRNMVGFILLEISYKYIKYINNKY